MKSPRIIGYWSLVIGLIVLGMSFSFEVKAQVETQTFFIDNSYDLFGRKQIEAVLVRTDSRLYFYVEKPWWESRSSQEQNDLRIVLAELGLEFQNRIYPVLTSTFGSEPKPGVDKDERITVLVHQMGGEAGGYFRSGDVYEKLQSPGSNEREMLYLNSEYIGKSQVKSFLAHEFTHLITINQKDLLRRTSEEIWLNEARAEYAPTLLGYDEPYQESNLRRRVRDFLENPTDSLTEWLNEKEDYGVINVFIQYLVDHYGVKVLTDSLQSSQVGISSLNEALLQNSFQQDFNQIFADWAIAVLVNDCSLGERYCYRNPHLKDVRITPTLYFIPRSETIFSTYHTATPWNANWHRLLGGAQNLILEFDGTDSSEFKVPYMLCEVTNACSTGYLSLDAAGKGKIIFSQFDARYSSLTIIPFLGNKVLELEGSEQPFAFSWEVRVEKERAVPTREESELINQLLARIAELQEQVYQLQARIAAFRDSNTRVVSCGILERNLSFGAQSQEVRCLQEFLAVQGQDVYPEGLVTGNFLALTKQAVIRFQEKYASDILAPLGLQIGTGYVGELTRNKINTLLKFSTALAI